MVMNASCDGEGFTIASISPAGADFDVGNRGGTLRVGYVFADPGTTCATSSEWPFVAEADVAAPSACLSLTASGCCALEVAGGCCCQDDCVS